MKLDKEQIAQIDETLVLNKVVYDDIKLELTDHIASDIEEMMADEKLSYEEAFKKAFEKWSVQLKPKTGFWSPEKNSFFFSGRTVAPKLIMDKLEKISKNQFLYSSLLSVIIATPTLVLENMYHSSAVPEMINNVYKILCLVVIGLLLLGRIVMFTSEGATTFGYLFKIRFFRTIWMPIFNLFLLSSLSAFSSVPIQYAILFTVVNFGLVRGILSFSLSCKHILFEKKLSKA